MSKTNLYVNIINKKYNFFGLSINLIKKLKKLKNKYLYINFFKILINVIFFLNLKKKLNIIFNRKIKQINTFTSYLTSKGINYNYIIFKNINNYKNNKLKKKGRIKRTIIKRIIKQNKITDF